MTDIEVRLSSPKDAATQQVVRALSRLRLADPSSLKELAADRLRRQEERALLAQARADLQTGASDEAEPLVTVRISTYERAEVLVNRTIPSVLEQTYERLEVLVVGDGTTDDTARRLAKVGDKRIRFVNLPYRPTYPADPAKRWRVLGYQALNHSLDLARGAWIAPCDDDDEMTPSHVESMLRAARDNRAEFVFSNTGVVLGDGVIGIIGRDRVAEGHTSHGAIFYTAGLRFFRYNGNVWRLRRSLDWDLVLRMSAAGVKMTYLDETTYKYHPSPASYDGYRRELLRRRPDLRPLLAVSSAPSE